MIPLETFNIETFNISYHAPRVAEHGPSFALQLSQWLGIQVVGIDGNILPMTAIVLMFAVWGMWYWMIMIRNAISSLPKIYRKIKGEDKE